MDASGVVRAARRRTGLSQRAFAHRCGVSPRQLAAIEAGTADPKHSTVAKLVAAADLELTLVPRTPAADGRLRGYLRESTFDRLQWSFTGRVGTSRSGDPRWLGLIAVSSRGHVRLDGPAGVGLWLPVRVGPEPLPIVLHRPTSGWTPEPQDRFPGLVVTATDQAPPAGDVSVVLWAARDRVHVPTPVLLAAHPGCEEHAGRLRAVAALFHETATRDEQGRRRPAHRDCDDARESHDVFHRREHRDRQLPSAQDSRSWRLGQAASLRQWLSDHPYAT